jgi:hypothetical protein
VTGPLERPSQGAPENRKAADYRKPIRDVVRNARRALSSVMAAEMQLLIAAQRDERARAISAVQAGLRSQHASATAAVVARFADRRTALMHIADPGARRSAAQRLALEEASELACLVIEHAAETRRLRNRVLAVLLLSQRAARTGLRQSQRYQRACAAIRVQEVTCKPVHFRDVTSPAPRRSATAWRWLRPIGKAGN